MQANIELVGETKRSGFRFWLLAAAIVTFLLIIAGNLVSVTGSSGGCPDFPTCYGQWGIPEGVAARLVYAHRALAALSGVMIALAALWALVKRLDRLVWLPLLAGTLLLLAESALGRWYRSGDPALVSLLHSTLALLVLALVIVATAVAFFQAGGHAPGRLSFRAPFARLSLAALLGTLVVMMSGTFLAAGGSGQACAGFPLCGNTLIPSDLAGWAQFGHRLLTLAVSLVVAWLFFAAWRSQRSQQVTLTAATGVGILFFGQVLIGALKVTRGYPIDLVGLHATATAALWASLSVLVVSTGLAARSPEEERAESREPLPFKARLHDFFVLSKPIIVALLLVTTYSGMVVGGKQIPSLALTLWTMLGGALAAGGASAINQYIDRDLDKNMQRTAKRPLASGRMQPAEGLAYGLGACLLAFFILAGFVNLLAALLSLAGMIYYVLIYSVLLKTATVLNIVIGGGAGAIPPLVGWAAAAGSLNVPSLFLFAIVFFWTPPHFWSLALVRRKDYARAGVPMMPVVRGEQVTRTQIFIYSLELVALTLLMPVFKITGGFYLVSAVVLGGLLIYSAWRLLRLGGNKTAWMMYRYSSMYLALLFLALVVDVLV